MQNIQFGSGVVTITPNAGNLPTNPTPIRLKVLQESNLDFKGELKKLFGQQQVAVASARGKVDITGKLKVGALSAFELNQIMFAQSKTSGGALPYDETHTTAASVTPTVGSGLAVTLDQGVVNFDTGDSMEKVASAPAIGQYSFTPAVTGGSPTAASYTFNASETASKVILSFLSTTTGGSTVTLLNQNMGFAPVCKAVMWNQFRGATEIWDLHSVTLGGVSRPSKQDDFWIADIDYSVNADASGTIGTVYTV